MALSTIALCSRALIKIGAASIASFDEGTAESEVAANLYPSLRDALLSSHPWNFASAQITLARLVSDPVADYAYAYQLPADFLRALSAGSGSRGRGIAYRISENRLHCDVEHVVLSYIFRPDESNFPAFFDQVIIARLAAEFCIPLTDSTSRTETLFKLAEIAFRDAKVIDSQQVTPGRIDDFCLINVRS
jgi:hypothetical protein